MLQLVTDRRRLCHGCGEGAILSCLVAQARYAVEAGMDVIRVRESDLEARPLAALVSHIVAVAKGSSTRVVVTDRLDVALACGAAGVHLRGDSMPAEAVRSMTPDGFIVGRSVHGLEEAVAVESSVDYLVAGTVWETASKPAGHTPLGIGGLARLTSAVRVPVLAIGGVTLERVAEVARAGAAGVAAIGLFMGPASPRAEGCRAVALNSTVTMAKSAFGLT
jgi:thiamine-phosphate diphosphorylase